MDGLADNQAGRHTGFLILILEENMKTEVTITYKTAEKNLQEMSCNQ